MCSGHALWLLLLVLGWALAGSRSFLDEPGDVLLAGDAQQEMDLVALHLSTPQPTTLRFNATFSGSPSGSLALHIYLTAPQWGSWRVRKPERCWDDTLPEVPAGVDRRFCCIGAVTASAGVARAYTDSMGNGIASEVDVELVDNDIAFEVSGEWVPAAAEQLQSLGVMAVVLRKDTAAVHAGDLPAEAVVADVLDDKSRCDQVNQMWNYCAERATGPALVPYGMYCQPVMRTADSVGDDGGNMCASSPSRTTAKHQYGVAADGVLALREDASALPHEFGVPFERVRMHSSECAGEYVRVQLIPEPDPPYRVPEIPVPCAGVDEHSPAQPVRVSEEPFGFAVVDGVDTLFNSTPGTTGATFSDLVFTDRYVEFSTSFGFDGQYDAYGLGERASALRLDNDHTYAFSAIDQGTTPDMVNLYGVHPFLLLHATAFPSGERWYGLFLNNNHDMEITLAPHKITFRLSGGLVDLFVLVGRTAKSVVAQYHRVVGLPALPPRWSLGFHQCRWGYQNVGEMREVIAGYEQAGLPLDTIWSDIDYMDNKKLFTLDEENFSARDMRAFVEELHQRKKHYVLIVDPGVRVEDGYPAYEHGLDEGIFIRNATGDGVALGKVWPGFVSFVDFSNPNAQRYWTEELRAFHSQVAFDGLWIDMNEIASFCDGHCVMDPHDPSELLEENLFSCACDETLQYDEADVPHHFDFGCIWPNGLSSDSSTISMAALHWNDVPERDLHSLYGHLESIASKTALEDIRNERALVITRSTFAGTGHHVGHWLGDNASTWKDMRASIPGMLAMNMFGIPLVGADICGFAGDTEEELCLRWMQLGAFYPFSRNHNIIGGRSQEPYSLGTSVVEASRHALQLRYSLIPHMYALFYEAHLHGGTVVRPLFFEFANRHLSEDNEFMLGPSLLLAPVLEPGVQEMEVILPYDGSACGVPWIWYETGEAVPASRGDCERAQIVVELTTIPLFQRPFSVVVSTAGTALTTEEAEELPLTAQVYVPGCAQAPCPLLETSVFIDDGVHISGELHTHVEISGYVEREDAQLSGVVRFTMRKNAAPVCNRQWRSLTLVCPGCDEVGARLASSAHALEVREVRKNVFELSMGLRGVCESVSVHWEGHQRHEKARSWDGFIVGCGLVLAVAAAAVLLMLLRFPGVLYAPKRGSGENQEFELKESPASGDETEI